MMCKGVVIAAPIVEDLDRHDGPSPVNLQNLGEQP
jgi:hypothetical protein